jgi:hypothetical protein
LRLYSEPIKYKTEEGKYEYVDTSLTEVTSDGSGKIYGTSASDVSVSMSEDLNQDNAVQLAYKDYVIAFKPAGILTTEGKSSADISFTDADTGVLEDTLQDTDQCGSIVYSKTLTKNRHCYYSVRYRIKEEIVLNAMPTQTEYSFVFNGQRCVPYFAEMEYLFCRFAERHAGCGNTISQYV